MGRYAYPGKMPIPALEEQNLIAAKYIAVLDEISVLKIKLEKALNRLNHVFDEKWRG